MTEMKQEGETSLKTGTRLSDLGVHASGVARAGQSQEERRGMTESKCQKK